ncbi:MAG: DUF2924 domain-containing protein [Planctomycetia bacterium]|nr:DUF2924 domain-containing protein [Planctomycetia bacterium]
MNTIEIDFDVYKKLTSLRETENVTYNDVIRRLLDLPQKRQEIRKNIASLKTSLICKGVEFPEGTEFKSHYKGRHYRAVVEDGFIILNGKKYKSPSPAAVSITNNSVNGWIFWECKLPNNQRWITLKSLRN